MWRCHGQACRALVLHAIRLTDGGAVRDARTSDAVQSIMSTAFKTSPYPVILSFENHCSVQQQRKLAQYCREAFGGHLLTELLASDETEMPSPQQLMYRIIIKAKVSSGHKKRITVKGVRVPPSAASTGIASLLPRGLSNIHLSANADRVSVDGSISDTLSTASDRQSVLGDYDAMAHGASDTRYGRTQNEIARNITEHDGAEYLEVNRFAPELVAIVPYCRGVAFKGFDKWQQVRYYELSSFAERKAMEYVRKHGRAFTEYNARRLTRIYPNGLRFDSSNYDPQKLWNVGSHMVAINFQTPDRPMHLNQGKFELNGRCGYILKPACMLQAEGMVYDPNRPETFATYGVQPMKLILHILSGQLLYHLDERSRRHRVQPQIEASIAGVPCDTRTTLLRPIVSDRLSCVINETVAFDVRMPEMALLYLCVLNAHNKTVVAQTAIPVPSLRPGYRVVPLGTATGVPINESSLFVRLEFGVPAK